jgi:hypothetical protein
VYLRDDAQPTTLERAFPKAFSHRLGQIGDERPAQISTPLALAGIETLGALALDGSERAAMEALDSVLLAHTAFFGCRRALVLPLPGSPGQSVEYLG